MEGDPQYLERSQNHDAYETVAQEQYTRSQRWDIVCSKLPVRNKTTKGVTKVRLELVGSPKRGGCVLQCGVSFSVPPEPSVRCLVEKDCGPQFEAEHQKRLVQQRSGNYCTSCLVNQGYADDSEKSQSHVAYDFHVSYPHMQARRKNIVDLKLSARNQTTRHLM
jgi:hypothetical protein